MNILVVGSTGPQGREFVAQALGAGHGVRALARDPSALQPAPSLEIVRGDVFDPSSLDAAVHGLAFDYPGCRALDDVTFRLEAETITALVGPNGAGKTTLLGMITGQVVPTSGNVYIFGHLVAPGAPVLSRIGIALEQPGLIPHLTGWQVLHITWAITPTTPWLIVTTTGTGD